MKHFGNKHLRALIITLIILAVMSVLSLGSHSLISGGFNALTKGLFRLTAMATEGMDKPSYEELEEENQRLRAETDALRRQLTDYTDLQAENKRLWQFYDMQKHNPSYKLKPANVIRRDSGDDFYSFTLDIGSADGVDVNDPVITESGLAGWVCRVDAATCKVKTVLSPDTKAGAADKRTGDTGIISGTAALCDQNLTSMGKLAENNKLKEGDLIVTSGTGGVYPGNLIIGTVRELRFNGYDTSRYAVITPAVDVRRITAAAVMTDFEGKGEVVKSDEK